MNKRLTIAPGFFLMAFFLGFIVTGCVNKTKGNSASAEEFEADMDKYDGPEQRLAFEIEQTRDLTTGKVPWEKLVTAIQQTETSKRSAANRTEALAWSERGPDGDFNGPSGNSRPNQDQTSGRVRAAMVDSLDPTRKTVFIGSVSGGLWKTTDITTAPSNWILVNDQMANLAIADICQDPRPGFQNIMYCCTGESYGNIDAVRGVGVFKSVDGGNNWNFLSNTSSYYRGTRILCDYLGNVYLGTRSTGLLRSSDGGASWTNITPTGLNSDICDMEISSTAVAGRLHVCTGIGSTQGYRFTDAPSTVSTASGWTAPTTTFISGSARAEIAVMGNVLYALPVNSSDQVASIYKSIDGGDNWAVTGGQPSPASWVNQGWYCVTAAINPSNPDECIVGGLDCHKTTNGGTSWIKISTWASTVGQYVHADQHDIQWWDGGSKLLFSSDGGEHFSSNGGTTIRDRNKGLRIKQFYSVAIHPTLTNYFLAGAQDNGVHRLHHPGLDSSIEVTGGDGCYVAIDQDQGQYQFGSYVYNVYRRSTNGGGSWSTPVNNQTTGRFINPWDYDNAGNKIYACNNANTYLRWNDPQTGSSTEVMSMAAFAGGNVSAVHVSPYTANRVFFGTGIGGIIKVDNAESATPTGTMINSGAGMSGYVNCVVTGSSEQYLLATITNYSAMSVWFSSNGGTTWTGIEGNLPDMPVRWAMFHPDTDTKAFIATETGVWETDLINGASTIWTANSGFPNCRTDMIKYRAADRTIAAGTHGRGIWTATVPVVPGFSLTAPAPATASCPVPATMSLTLGTNSIGGFANAISLSAISGVPLGTTVSFGTNPVTPGSASVVTLNNTNTLAAGTYVITIQGMATGAATRTTNITYTINPGSGPTINTHPLSQAVCDGSNVSFSVAATGTYQWQVSTNNGSTWADIGSAMASTYSLTSVTVSLNANQYRCVLTNSCGSISSNAAVLTVNALPPKPVITAGGPLTLCSGANVVLTSSSASGNQWYKDDVMIGGETNQTYTATTAGSYTVIVTAGSCVSPKSLPTLVTVSTPPATPVINWNGSQLSTTAGFASYQWYLNNIAISGATAAAHSPVFSGLYKVTITNTGGCSATSADFNLVATAVNNLTLNGVQYSLSPNPATDVINIKVNGNNPGKVQLRMISSTGAEMMRISNISNAATLLVSNYPAGVYYILLNGKTEKGTFKVIINH